MEGEQAKSNEVWWIGIDMLVRGAKVLDTKKDLQYYDGAHSVLAGRRVLCLAKYKSFSFHFFVLIPQLFPIPQCVPSLTKVWNLWANLILYWSIFLTWASHNSFFQSTFYRINLCTINLLTCSFFFFFHWDFGQDFEPYGFLIQKHGSQNRSTWSSGRFNFGKREKKNPHHKKVKILNLAQGWLVELW